MQEIVALLHCFSFVVHRSLLSQHISEALSACLPLMSATLPENAGHMRLQNLLMELQW